jgi:tRNA 2-thiouridine synthesizing protein E
MYPNMQIKTIMVNGREIQTDGEGYIVNLDEWSEDFVHVQASAEGLLLTDEHWEVVRFLRDYWQDHGV